MKGNFMYVFLKWLLFLSIALISYTATSAQTIWEEEFSGYSDGTTTGNDNNLPVGSDWTSSYGGSGSFSVQFGGFYATGMSDEGVWTSEVIDISGASYVKVEAYVEWFMTLIFSSSDYVRMYYKLDGGPEELFFERQNLFLSWTESSSPSRILSGSSLQIIVKVNTDNYVYFDDVLVSQVPILYSRANGNWNNGNTWSFDDFSGTQVSCGCVPTVGEVAVVGNGNRVNVSGDAVAGGIVVENTGVLRWTANAQMDIASGFVDVKSGGQLNNNGRIANIRFENGYSATFSNSGDANMSNLVLSVAGTSLELMGNSPITVLADIDFEQDDITFTNNLNATLSANRLLFDNDNANLINNGTIVTNSIAVNNNNDDRNVITNTSSGIISVGNISLANGDFTLNNSGTVNQTGNFVNGTIGMGSAFNNLDGGEWNWSHNGAPYDISVNAIMDCSNGVNTFNYSATGNQDVIPIAYSHLIISGSGVKSTQDDLVIKGDLYITGAAQLNVDSGDDNITLEGDWTNDSGHADALGEGTGTVVFNGGADQIITSSDKETFYGLTIDKPAGNIILGSAIEVTGTLTLNSGNMDIGVNDITVAASGSISGGSNSSFIMANSNGELIQNDLGATGRTGGIIFPVGSALTYNPLIIDNTSGVADNFGVHLCDKITLAGNCVDTEIVADVVNRMWFIEEAVDGGSDAILTFQWEATNELPGFDRTSINVRHFNGTDWDILSTGASGGSGPYTASASGVSDFSPFAIEGADSAPLPVELLYFEASLGHDEVELQWETASELNNDFFTVERSTDLKNFEEVKVINGKGTTATRSSYLAVDAHPPVGDLYYRLKQTDFDGAFSYSDIVKIHRPGPSEPLAIDLYPVPVHGDYIKLSLSGMTGEESVPVVIHDTQGKVIYRKEVSVANHREVTLNFERKLPQGLYILKLNMVKPMMKSFIVD